MKFRNITLAAALSLSAYSVAAQAPAPAPVSASAQGGAAATCLKQKLTTESLVGELLDDAGAKAVLINHIPSIKDNDQFDMARPMPLRAVQAYAEDTFTDKILDAIDADLAKLPLCGGAAK